jgi:hypothetical protein
MTQTLYEPAANCRLETQMAAALAARRDFIIERSRYG